MMDHFNFWGADEHGPSKRGRRHNPKKKTPIALAVSEIGRNVCFGGKDSAPAPQADPAVGQAALANIQLGQDWLSFAKDQFDEGNTRQDATDALTTKVINQQMDTQTQANQWATEDRDRYNTVYKPLQDNIIDQANNYATPDKVNEAAAQAKADVATSVQNQQQTSSRQMAAMGIAPDSGRAMATNKSAGINAAVASAGAQNLARTNTVAQGLALQQQVAGMGTGLPGQANSSAALGLTAGSSALAGNASANANFYQNNATMTNGYQGAISGNASGAGLLNNIYGQQSANVNQSNAQGAASSAATGQAVGGLAAAGIMAFAF